MTNFTNIPEIVRIPADKGTAIVCENEKEYIQKEDELLAWFQPFIAEAMGYPERATYFACHYEDLDYFDF